MAREIPWHEALRNLICMMYEAIGGDCDDLDWDGDGEGVATDKVIDLYREHRDAGGFPTSQAEGAFLSEIDDLEVHLAKPANSSSASVNAKLQGFIAEVRFDLGTTSSATSTRFAGRKPVGYARVLARLAPVSVIAMQGHSGAELGQVTPLGVLQTVCLVIVAWRVAG